MNSIQHPLPHGSKVRVTLFGGTRIVARIGQYERDIKNERDGYLLDDSSDGVEHWCYASQVEEVLS